jgi:hypothetical protein
MRSALIAGVALVALALPAVAQNTNPSTTNPPPAATQPTTPPASRTAPPLTTTQPSATPARMEGSHIIGLTLRNNANESIGDISDVIVDRDGRVREVVVGVGGFLGIGEHKVAIAWDQLHFDANRDVAVVNMTKDQLRAMPEYRAPDRTRTAPPATTTTPPPARQP